MVSLIDGTPVARLVRGRHPASAPTLGTCPACGRPVAKRDDSVRLRADWYAHRRCATYEVRYLGGLRADPAGRLLAGPSAPRSAPAHAGGD